VRVLAFGTYQRDYPRNAQVRACLRGAGVTVEEHHISVWDGRREAWSAGPAALARLAAASVDDIGAAAGRATAKAAGVVIDDTAVTPQYVHGITADRELPMIKRIAIGSLRNKLLFILPAALLLSQFAPWLLPWVLMVGATYLCYEGAEKVWGRISGHDAHSGPAAISGYRSEEYDRWLSDWRRFDFEMPNNAGQSRRKQRRTESLWVNW